MSTAQTGAVHETAQQTPLERACDRASLAGIETVGYVRFRDGSRGWLVPSTTEPDRLHIVRTHDHGHLRCDCPAGEHGRVCLHAAAVVMEVTAQAISRERFAERIAHRVEADAGGQLRDGCADEDHEHAAALAVNARGMALAQSLDITLAQAERRRAQARAQGYRDGYSQAQLDDTGRRIERVNRSLDAYDAAHPKLADDAAPVSIFKS